MQKIRPDMNIGQNIKRLRKQCSLTQDQVVAKLNLMNVKMSPSTYAKIETNRMNIRISELFALHVILDADFNDFFDGLQ